MVADAIAAHLLAAPFTQVDRIACHLSMGTEPGTGPLITGLLNRGVDVIVPVTSTDDHLLEWVVFDPAAPLRLSSIGVPEPDGPRLGSDALGDAGLIVVPAMAVDHAGNRLGRGAGYYDRALASVTAPVCAVVHANELDGDRAPRGPRRRRADGGHRDRSVPRTERVTAVSPDGTRDPA